MNIEDVLDLQRVDGSEFVRRFSAASNAVRAIDLPGENRWPAAAEQVCGFLDFTITEEPLWSGLHRAVDGLEGEDESLASMVGDALDDFVTVEFLLLVRSGLSETDAAHIADALRIGLLSFDRPTHEEVEELLVNLRSLHATICSVSDWSAFGDPEKQARRKVNLITALTGGGGLVATVVDAAATPVMPLFVASIAGGIASSIGSLLGWRRRR